MKKVIYIFAIIIGLFSISCEDSLEDTFEELGDSKQPIINSTEFTLTDQDYADLDKTTKDDTFEKFKSFSSEEDAKKEIAELLEEKFPVWDNGSSALVTFNFFKPNSVRGDVINYTVTQEDYEAQGGNIAKFGNFSKLSQITSFLKVKYPDAKNGMLVELTYSFLVSGAGVQTLTNKFFLTSDNVWSKPVVVLSEDDYDVMEQNFNNFRDDDIAKFKIGIYLKTLRPFTMSDDESFVIYSFSFKDDEGNRKSIDKILKFVYDGEQWNNIGSIIEQTIQFGIENGEWVPDNTIRYTLVETDYDTVVVGLTGDTALKAQVGNLKDFGNFNRTGGSTNWDDEAILKALNVVLKEKFPDSTERQKYLVTYSIFQNGTKDETQNVILDSEGNYVLVPKE